MSAMFQRRWYQFSLLSLFVVMAVVAIPAARIGYLRRMAEFHRREVDRWSPLQFPLLEEPEYDFGEVDRKLEFHGSAAAAYESAVYRPWQPVVVPPMREETEWEQYLRLSFERKSIPKKDHTID
ncbi:MAG: hypothetical protein ACKVP0_24325 [Pirellulaceae bacterium]